MNNIKLIHFSIGFFNLLYLKLEIEKNTKINVGRFDSDQHIAKKMVPVSKG